MGAKQHSLLQSAVDVIGFLLLSLIFIAQSILKAILPKQLKSLEGEIILVTGGGGGLGRLIALRLARLKAIVVLWDINLQGVEETVKLVEAIGGTAFGYKCDLANKEDVYKTAEVTRKEVGDVTILINNAGVASTKLLLETPDHLIQRTFDVNILAHFWTTKAFLPSMISKNHGHIVTIASMAGHVGIKKLVDYCSSKYAAVGFDEALRVELEAQGIKGVHTTCICPYFIQSTGMFDDVNSRFLPTLRPNDVADRIVEGLRANELYVMVPTLFRAAMILKWVFPWACLSMFLRNLVPDAEGHAPLPPKGDSKPTPITTIPSKPNAEITLNHRSAAVISERKP